MTSYQVTFYKTVTNSVGRERRIAQRVIPCAADSCDEAVRDALKAFIEAEQIGDWRIHADSLEVTPA